MRVGRLFNSLDATTHQNGSACLNAGRSYEKKVDIQPLLFASIANHQTRISPPLGFTNGYKEKPKGDQLS